MDTLPGVDQSLPRLPAKKSPEPRLVRRVETEAESLLEADSFEFGLWFWVLGL